MKVDIKSKSSQYRGDLSELTFILLFHAVRSSGTCSACATGLS